MFSRICTLFLALSLLLSSGALAELSLDSLEARLNSPDPAVRLDAVRGIAVEYPSDGLDALISAAADGDEYVRERAVQALGRSGSQRAVQVVLAVFDDPADFVRWRAVQAATRLGVRDVHQQLAALAGDRFWRVRLVTYQLLGEIGRELIVSGSPELASSPAGERVRNVLLTGLNDPDERARVAAARALAVSRDHAAYGPLVELLEQGSLFTREQAAVGLGELGDKQAVEPLIQALEDPRNAAEREGRDWARWGAAVALEQLTGQDFKINAEKWRQWLAADKQQ